MNKLTADTFDNRKALLNKWIAQNSFELLFLQLLHVEYFLALIRLELLWKQKNNIL